MRMTTLLDRLPARVTRRTALLSGAVVLALVAAGTTLTLLFSGPAQYQITAQFVATPGLYAHNAVTVLGVPTGRVVSIEAGSGYVDVVISLPRDVHIPANAQAVLMAPNPVSDRFVELTPPYASGPPLADGATIPLARTVVPLELDQVFESVDNLSKALGPSGANKSGDLTAALHAFAQLADGNGTNVHQAIVTISAALPALTAHPDQLRNLITGLDTLTRTLAARGSTLNSLYGDVATATSQLAGERGSIAAAIANLQQGLAQVTGFIRANQTNITGSITNLSTTVAAITKQQQSLIDTFDKAPLGFQNFNRSIDQHSDCISATGAPGNCAALWGRLNFTKDVSTFIKQYCGSSILASFVPILEANAHLATPQAVDTACGAQLGALQNRVGPPGSPNTPDLDLTHYLGPN